jgi:UDP-GlcNAc:undecaprenyl-phosphate/decaprenyl-phosphate GlcNAc-1-phosphate transferase
MHAEFTASDVLKPLWRIGAVAFGVSLITTPIVRAIAYKARIVDRPDDLLKPHSRPIAYMGGVSMCIGMLVALGYYIATIPHLSESWDEATGALSHGRIGALTGSSLWQLISIATATTVVMIVGLIDDIRNISPGKKVLGQVIASGILMLGGVGTRMADTFLHTADIYASDWIVIPASCILCIFVVVCACNATNLLDGLDGLCGGVTGIIALGFLALAVWLAMWNNFPGSDQVRVVLCLAVAGAVLGFLPYNIPPASIFMGDAGSMMLGFFVATMMALFCLEGHIRWLFASCVIFALPILDTSLAVIRRLRSGKGVFVGDRSHLYDQLVDRGMSVKQVVGLFYLLSILAAVIGVTLSIVMRARHAIVVYLVLLVMVWTIFYKLGLVTPTENDHASDAGDTEPNEQ